MYRCILSVRRDLYTKHNPISRAFSTSSNKMVKVIVGMMGSSAASGSASMATVGQVKEFLDACKSQGVNEIDTARAYNKGRSEELLGEVAASKDFTIETKAPAFEPGSLAYDKIIANCEKSLIALNLSKIPLYYLHGWDVQTPYEEQCRAIGKLHADGKFDKWGISNIGLDDVKKVIDICNAEGYPVPSVYQGGYNPVNRVAEGLFPLLRKHDVAFYAYSPLAGGLLAKPISEIKDPAKGSRFDAMPIFGQMYKTEKIMTQLEKLTAHCQELGITVMEATLRWFMHHSPLREQDGVILGASSIQQIEASLAATKKGPLDDQTVDIFETLWRNIKSG